MDNSTCLINIESVRLESAIRYDGRKQIHFHAMIVLELPYQKSAALSSISYELPRYVSSEQDFTQVDISKVGALTLTCS